MCETYRVNISDEFEQQRDGLSGSNSHVDVIVLQQTRKFRQMSEKWPNVRNPEEIEPKCFYNRADGRLYTYFSVMALMWLPGQMVRSRAQDRRALVWSCVV